MVIDAEDEDIELVNPEIVSVSDETQTGLEGCLSLPGKWGIVTRPLRATVRAQDRYGDWYEYEGEELLARRSCMRSIISTAISIRRSRRRC